MSSARSISSSPGSFQLQSCLGVFLLSLLSEVWLTYRKCVDVKCAVVLTNVFTAVTTILTEMGHFHRFSLLVPPNPIHRLPALISHHRLVLPLVDPPTSGVTQCTVCVSFHWLSAMMMNTHSCCRGQSWCCLIVGSSSGCEYTSSCSPAFLLMDTWADSVSDR